MSHCTPWYGPCWSMYNESPGHHRFGPYPHTLPTWPGSQPARAGLADPNTSPPHITVAAASTAVNPFIGQNCPRALVPANGAIAPFFVISERARPRDRLRNAGASLGSVVDLRSDRAVCGRLLL